jgi:hypothetical protein
MNTNNTVTSTLLLALIGAVAATLPASASAQESFKTPQAAAQALVAAGKANDNEALIRIFGKDHAALVQEDSDPSVAPRRKQFLDAADKLILYREDDKDQVTLVVGEDAYPFPIPLVRKGGKWQFDAEQGEEELINRRVGLNELATISVLEDVVKAEFEYARESRDGSGVRQFAGRLMSSEGKHDGLYWPSDGFEQGSPLGPLAAEKGVAVPGSAYYGYHYRVLTKQGEKAPGGAYDYMINGRLLAGFAILAYPAAYGDSGVTSFVVNHYGQVYQADLGEDTEAKAMSINAYEPGEGWIAVSEAAQVSQQ